MNRLVAVPLQPSMSVVDWLIANRDGVMLGAIVAAAIVAVMLVAFSRMYLGAHYLSDVMAATCSSTAWLVLCLSGVHALIKRLRKAPR